MSIARWLYRLKAVFRKSRVEEDLSEELQFDLQLEIEKNINAGMSSEKARYAALRTFGGVDQVTEACRELQHWSRFEALWRDLKHPLRGLKKSPSFTALAVISL